MCWICWCHPIPKRAPPIQVRLGREGVQSAVTNNSVVGVRGAGVSNVHSPRASHLSRHIAVASRSFPRGVPGLDAEFLHAQHGHAALLPALSRGGARRTVPLLHGMASSLADVICVCMVQPSSGLAGVPREDLLLWLLLSCHPRVPVYADFLTAPQSHAHAKDVAKLTLHCCHRATLLAQFIAPTQPRHWSLCSMDETHYHMCLVYHNPGQFHVYIAPRSGAVGGTLGCHCARQSTCG